MDTTLSLAQVIGLSIAAIAVIGSLAFIYLEYKRGNHIGN